VVDKAEINLLMIDKNLNTMPIRIQGLDKVNIFIDKIGVKNALSNNEIRKNKGKRELHKNINEFLETIGERK